MSHYLGSKMLCSPNYAQIGNCGEMKAVGCESIIRRLIFTLLSYEPITVCFFWGWKVRFGEWAVLHVLYMWWSCILDLNLSWYQRTELHMHEAILSCAVICSLGTRIKGLKCKLCCDKAWTSKNCKLCCLISPTKGGCNVIASYPVVAKSNKL